MKRGKVLMTVLVVIAVLFASCASHLGEDENAAASKAVKINFAMVVDEEAVQKAVALHGGVNDFKFFYMADPQWDSDDPIQGDTGGNYVEISSNLAHITDSNRVSIGYFKPGLWKFDVVITSSDGTPATAKNLSKVIYRASNDWKNATYSLFDSSDRTVDLPAVPMVLYGDAEGAKATITLKLAVPKIKTDAAPDVTLTISEGPSAAGEVTVKDNEHPPVANKKTGNTYSADPVAADNWYYFTTTISNVIPGKYTLYLKYYDKDHLNSGAQVGGATIATTILPTTYTIWGKIDNGEYQIATVTLDVPVFELDFEAKAGNQVATSVAQGGTMVCTPDPLKNDPAASTYTMKWYVNGALQSAGIADDTGVFTFNTSSTTSTAIPGEYEIVCAAVRNVDSAATYKSYTVTVDPPAAINVTTTSSTVVQSGALTFTATSTPANSTLQWYVKKDGGAEVLQEGATGSTFTFNTSSTTSTANTGEYEVILKATGEASIGGGQTGYGSRIVTVTPVAP